MATRHANQERSLLPSTQPAPQMRHRLARPVKVGSENAFGRAGLQPRHKAVARSTYLSPILRNEGPVLRHEGRRPTREPLTSPRIAHLPRRLHDAPAPGHSTKTFTPRDSTF